MEILGEFLCVSDSDIWEGLLQAEQLNEDKHHTGTLSIWEGDYSIGCTVHFLQQKGDERKRKFLTIREGKAGEEGRGEEHDLCCLASLKIKKQSVGEEVYV